MGSQSSLSLQPQGSRRGTSHTWASSLFPGTSPPGPRDCARYLELAPWRPTGQEDALSGTAVGGSSTTQMEPPPPGNSGRPGGWESDGPRLRRAFAEHPAWALAVRDVTWVTLGPCPTGAHGPARG